MSTIFLDRDTHYCKGCPLSSTPNRSKHVPTEVVKLTSEPGVDVLFIGEAPGENEAIECRPFIGKSGKYVRGIINKYANANYAIGNACRCRPTDDEGNNRAPTPEERAHCIRYTLEHIQKLKPKKIVCLGGVSTGAFIDGFRSVASIRGQEIPWKSPKGFETLICPTYHPAARDMYQLSFVPKDIRKAFKKPGEKSRKWDEPGKEVVLYELSKIKKLLKHILEDLPEDAVVSVDVETLNGINRIDNRCISIAFSWDGKKGYSFPLDHPKAPWTPKELKTLKKWLRHLFTSEDIKFNFWEGHNSKFEIQQLHTYLGIWARNRPWLDTMLITFLNDENRLTMKKQMSPFSLKQLSAEKLGLPYEDEEILRYRERGELWKLPWKKVCKYNCLHYGVPVILEDGSTAKIGDIVRERRKVKVLSYGKNGIEAKPIVNWFQNHEPNQDWIQIKLEGTPGFKSRQLVVTPDHGVFTDQGKVRADQIRKGDRVLVNEPVLSKYERSALLGSMMGDASFLTSPSQRGDWSTTYSAMFKCGHVESSGIAQWKIGVLGNWISWERRTKKYKAVWASTGKEYTHNPFITFGTKHFRQFSDLASLCYQPKGKGRVKTVTLEWLKELGPVGMAWWFMDDGFKNGKTVALSTNGFDKKSLKLLESWFTERFGYSYVCKYGVLRLGVEATQAFCKYIATHLPEPARYKLPEGEWAKFKAPTQNKMKKAYTAKVEYARTYTPPVSTRHDKYLADHNFCIEVEGNHNFFTPFGLVSNCEDAWKTRRLHDKEMEDAGDFWPTLLRISKYIYSPALFMFAGAEKNGFKINIEHLYELQSPNSSLIKAMKAIDELFRKDKDVIAVNNKLASRQSGGMKPLFGLPWVFSPDKKAHLIELFVKRLKLKPLRVSKKTKEPSLDTEYYEAYAEESELAAKMAERQEIKKLLTSYFDQIRNFLENDPECADGRVRPSFRMDTVVTGRTSCQEPNLQQIPKGEEEGGYAKATKNMFTVEPGNVLISGDLKQGEVVLMAQTTGDKMFAKAIWRMKEIADQYWVNPTPEAKLILDTECDTHRQSAAILYGVDVAKVTKEQRNNAKAIVTFGIIYGKHIKTIAADLKTTEEKAQKTQDKFFGKFPESKKGLLRLEKMATTKGYVESSIGRRRRLPQALSPDQGEANRALRQARNSPIQSLLSDYTLFQAGRLNEYILDHGLNWKIVDVVHDAVLCEVPFAEAKRYIKVTRRIMTDIHAFEKAFSIKMIVPMLVDFDAGISYGALSGVESWSKGDKSLKAALKKVKKQWKERGYDLDKQEEEEYREAA